MRRRCSLAPAVARLDDADPGALLGGELAAEAAADGDDLAAAAGALAAVAGHAHHVRGQARASSGKGDREPVRELSQHAPGVRHQLVQLLLGSKGGIDDAQEDAGRGDVDGHRREGSVLAVRPDGEELAGPQRGAVAGEIFLQGPIENLGAHAGSA